MSDSYSVDNLTRKDLTNDEILVKTLALSTVVRQIQELVADRERLEGELARFPVIGDAVKLIHKSSLRTGVITNVESSPDGDGLVYHIHCFQQYMIGIGEALEELDIWLTRDQMAYEPRRR